MKIIKIAHILLAFVSGVLLIGYGGLDDSPGAQGIGLLTIIGSIILIIFTFKELKNKAKF
jgi:Na+/melibiose symporter-like transporter